MKTIHFLILASIIAIIGSANCKIFPENEPPPLQDIFGSVVLYDEGDSILDPSGMSIRIEEYGLEHPVLTDDNGEFVLPSIPLGEWTIVYEKPGYGTFEYWFLHYDDTKSGEIIDTPFLGKLSTTTITQVESRLDGNDYIISVITNPAGDVINPRYIRYFLDENDQVSEENHSYFSEIITVDSNPFEFSISQSELSNSGFSSGTTLYLRVYGDSFKSNIYTEYYTFKMIFPNLNPTTQPAISFVP